MFVVVVGSCMLGGRCLLFVCLFFVVELLFVVDVVGGFGCRV